MTGVKFNKNATVIVLSIDINFNKSRALSHLTHTLSLDTVCIIVGHHQKWQIWAYL